MVNFTTLNFNNLVNNSEIVGKHLTISEKLDGTGVSIEFPMKGKAIINSNYDGNSSHPAFKMLKEWVGCQSENLLKLIGTRYILFGEWLYAKKVIFYDSLPHYFFEFDVYDKDKNIFLSALERKSMFTGTIVCSVPEIWNGATQKIIGIEFLCGNSNFKSKNWKKKLDDNIKILNTDASKIYIESDPESSMEGLYIKIEGNDRVTDRYKYIRPNFAKYPHKENSAEWLKRPLIKNELSKNIQLLFKK